MILEAHKAVRVRQQIFLSQLHDRVRFTTGAWSGKADWLHRAEAQGMNTAPSCLFDWQTGLKPARLFEALQRNTIGGYQRLVETSILCLIKGTIQIIVASFVVARRPKGNLCIYRIGRDDRRDGVVEIKLIAAGQLHDFCGQGFGRKRSGGNNAYLIVRDAGYFFTNQFNARVLSDLLSDISRELFTINSQGCSRRNSRGGSRLHDERISPAQLLLQEI